MGPLGDYRRSQDLFWRNLFGRRMVACDQFELGIKADEDGQVIDAFGMPVEGLYTLGTLRRGSLYETTAVPELRVQTKQLADKLLSATQETLAG